MKENLKTVKIERIVPGGSGIAFADGLTIFVGLAAMGDELRIHINQKKGKVAFAEIVEIINPSPDRIKPDCEYFGKCGGCDFQQMNYQAQLAAKVAIIRDCLKRIGKIDYPKDIDIVPSPQQWGYRSRAQWHADTRTKRLGYFKRGSHQVWDIEKCLVLAPGLEKELARLKENLEWETFWGENIEIEAASSDANVSVFSAELIETTEKISFEAAGERYFYDASCFFQGNQLLIEKLIEAATIGFEGEKALDLYCGVGLFALPLARKFKSVIGIEENEKAIHYACENAEFARLANTEFHAENTSEWLSHNAEKLTGLDLIVLDPPRSGADKETIAKVLDLAPKHISYVSCDPATLARDLHLLCNEKYEVETLKAFDLFPQTHHVETVVRLKQLL